MQGVPRALLRCPELAYLGRDLCYRHNHPLPSISLEFLRHSSYSARASSLRE